MSIALIRSHYGFTKMPFGKDISSDSLFGSVSHLEAVARIGFLVYELGIGVITGEVGSGKTVAARKAMSKLEPSTHSVIYVSNPALGSKGIYNAIVTHLGEQPCFYKGPLISQVTSLLSTEVVEKRRKVILVCDEAHLLSGSELEELRFLTNSEMDSSSSFALILVGQPSLRQRLKLGTNSALDQRVSLRCVLAPMTRAETSQYISHHLELAGRKDSFFGDDAISLIHQVSRGLPRSVNNLCRQALVASCFSSSTVVDEKSVRQAITEADSE